MACGGSLRAHSRIWEGRLLQIFGPYLGYMGRGPRRGFALVLGTYVHGRGASPNPASCTSRPWSGILSGPCRACQPPHPFLLSLVRTQVCGKTLTQFTSLSFPSTFSLFYFCNTRLWSAGSTGMEHGTRRTWWSPESCVRPLAPIISTDGQTWDETNKCGPPPTITGWLSGFVRATEDGPVSGLYASHTTLGEARRDDVEA